MQSTTPTSGSLVADHCHTFTSQRFYYRASYRCEGSNVLWWASVRLGRNTAEQLHGITSVNRHAPGVMPAVKNAVETAIDRHAFFESDWGGLSGLSELPRPMRTPTHSSGAAAHG
jgi:hypothetical protein